MDELAKERLTALVAEIGRFHVTQRRLRREQDAMAKAIARGVPPSPRRVRGYLAAVRNYFVAFEREANVQLRSVDRRLGAVSQLQYNLSAERGVAAGRVDAVANVLRRLQELAP